MEAFFYMCLFFLGLGFGSFVNVLATRYDPDRSVFKATSWRGRSHCEQCGKLLVWYELIPLVSYVVQRGRCRTCRVSLSVQYPLIEFITALLFVMIPARSLALFGLPSVTLGSVYVYGFILAWLLFALIAILIAVIDFHHQLIPDELNVCIAALGLLALGGYYYAGRFDPASGSLLGSYALMFGSASALINRMVGFLFGIVFYGVIIVASRGRAMGMGDLKLSAALGVLMGWPDVAVSTGLAFIVGSVVSLGLMARGRKSLKDLVPFGPFILAGAFLVFFAGQEIVCAYFSLFGIMPWTFR